MEDRMTAEDPVALYYDAWRNRRGDFSDVPLAEDFRDSSDPLPASTALPAIARWPARPARR
jgi:hypothetical protein